MQGLADHAGTVLGAYAVALGLLGLIVGLSWSRSVRVRRRLAQVEARLGRGAGDKAAS